MGNYENSFDEPIDRLNSNSLKWDNMKKLYGVDPKEGLAMWVADMDFKAPQAVNECIKEIDTRSTRLRR